MPARRALAVRLSAESIDELDALAQRAGMTRAEVIRLMLSNGWKVTEKELDRRLREARP